MFSPQNLSGGGIAASRLDLQLSRIARITFVMSINFPYPFALSATNRHIQP